MAKKGQGGIYTEPFILVVDIVLAYLKIHHWEFC